MSLTEEKYCSVAAMLKKTAAFTWRYEILSPQPPAQNDPTRAIIQKIRPRLFPANRILYNQSFPNGVSSLQGEICLAASPQKSRV